MDIENFETEIKSIYEKAYDQAISDCQGVILGLDVGDPSLVSSEWLLCEIQKRIFNLYTHNKTKG